MSTPSRASTRAPKKASAQPRRPHEHGGPSSARMVWPISPAMPCAPVNRRSLSTTPAPTPTSQLTKISGSSPSPAANSYSPSAAASASFCSCTVTPVRPAAASASSSIGSRRTLRQPRLGAKRTSPVQSSTAPGTHTPMLDSRSPRSASRQCAAAAMRATCAQVPAGALSASACSSECNTSPCSETQASRAVSTAISMPMSARTPTLICSGVEGRPSPSATAAPDSLSQPSSSSSRTRRLTVDLVRPLSLASRARDSPGRARRSRSSTLRFMRLSSCWSPMVFMRGAGWKSLRPRPPPSPRAAPARGPRAACPR